MSSISFFKLVVKMRKAQKDYYESRFRGDLRYAYALEQRVDEEIKKGLKYLADHPELEEQNDI